MNSAVEDGPAEAADPQGRVGESLTIVLAISMLMALGYLGEVGWKHLVRSTFVAASRDVTWMAPISAAVFGATLLTPIWLAAPFLPRATARAMAVAGSIWLTTFAFLLPWTQIHRLAAAVLALGVAVVGVRWCTSTRRVRLTQRLGFAAALMLLISGGLISLVRDKQSHAANLARPAPPPSAPNVLVLLLDTVRASALGMYGYPRATSPVLDSLAGGGVVFEHAVSTAPWTLPSHGSLFTGEYPGLLSASFRSPLDASRATLAELFQAAGYETVGFVGNIDYTAWDSGLSRGFQQWIDYPLSVRQVLRSGWIGQSNTMKSLLHAQNWGQVFRALRHPQILVEPKPGGDALNATRLANALLGWERGRGPRPYFAFVNFFDAHETYAPPTAYRGLFTPDPGPRDLYDGEIAYIDHEVGRMLDSLRRRGALDNTIIVLLSDHGELFEEHGINGHGNSLYYQLLHIPLMIRFDGHIPAGRRVPEVVSLRDVGATLLDLADLQSSNGFPGHSLVPLWSGGADSGAARSPAISELTQDPIPQTEDPLTRSQFLSLVQEDGNHAIFRNIRQRRPLLFNIRSDAAGLHNLAETASGLATYDSLEQRMRRLLEQQQPGVPRQ